MIDRKIHLLTGGVSVDKRIAGDGGGDIHQRLHNGKAGGKDNMSRLVLFTDTNSIIPRHLKLHVPVGQQQPIVGIGNRRPHPARIITNNKPLKTAHILNWRENGRLPVGIAMNDGIRIPVEAGTQRIEVYFNLFPAVQIDTGNRDKLAGCFNLQRLDQLVIYIGE
ncbi:hypothetical protein Barb7_02934 [Bacteroidales bacterium Barb7]|nr:hypothetical protein Barb7_02934 [Bacteroidales bacterium Barb7]